MSRRRRTRRSRRSREERRPPPAAAEQELPVCEHCSKPIFPGEESIILHKAILEIDQDGDLSVDEVEFDDGQKELWYHGGCYLESIHEGVTEMAHEMAADLEDGLTVCPSCGTHVTECNHCGEDLTNYWEIPY